MKKINLLFLSMILVAAVGCNQNPPDGGGTDATAASGAKRSAKRGVSFSFSSPDGSTKDVPVLAKGVSWFYTWGSGISDELDEVIIKNGVAFVPMCWSGVDNNAINRITAYKQKHPELEYILGFNEPNLTDQSNMTPAQCAPKWRQLMALAETLNLKLVAPAMNYGTLSGYSDPIKWLDEFFTLVPLESADVIAIHCYMPNSGAVISFVDKFKKYGKPIWMTEFCAWDGINSVDEQMKFMSEVVNYFEAEPQIERYAWFIPRGSESDNARPWNKLLKHSGAELLPLGQVYLGISYLDKSVWADAGKRIEAENFTNSSVAENSSNNFHYKPTTDADGNLEISDFTGGCWAEYQVNAATAGEYALSLRYACYDDVIVEVSVNGNVVVPELIILQTGGHNIWQTEKIDINLAAGHNVVRFKNRAANLTFNWLQVDKK